MESCAKFSFVKKIEYNILNLILNINKFIPNQVKLYLGYAQYTDYGLNKIIKLFSYHGFGRYLDIYGEIVK